MRSLTDNEANTESGRKKISIASFSDFRHTYWSNNENRLGQLMHFIFQQVWGACVAYLSTRTTTSFPQ